ncbi:Methyltransferase type 11 [Anaeromyxobacter dehalogenans 2CP-1]|uniref:Methyltransferase type 11 n=1 Tax=Anaeromyxobacter dehalogenans (strain ATCC BAA-258 / DSM 21875 / 2CP-1) TaxID=455488 RepID=B8J4Y5_ANAD2|nr:glycosyltransferase [Anaeromyxobacter dehalogenans]ACL64840.1 Methyltransferase type 11 [Anaeromyxobacter dehalogenans 2CP-1]
MAAHAVNSAAYWEARFATGDWDAHGGPAQARFFAEVALSLLAPEVVDDLRARRATICDLGCGEGEGTATLAAGLGVPVAGADVSGAAVAVARRRHPGLAFERADGAPPGEVDALFTSNTLEHFRDPWGVLAAALGRVRRWAVLLVPFEERERIPEHEATFEWESFPAEVAGFDLWDLRAEDVSARPGSRWPGAQALAVYARRGAPDLPARPAPAVAALAARAAALAAVGRALAAERDAWRAERDALAAALARAEGWLSREAGALAAALEQARAPRGYAAGRLLGALRRAPAGALRGSLRGARARWRSGDAEDDRSCAAAAADALGAPDPLRDGAAAARALAAGLPPPPPSADPPYRAHVRALAERATIPGPRRSRSGDALRALAARARGAPASVVFPPLLPWTFLRQRPQQLARALARRGCAVVFCTPDPARDDVDGLRELEPGLFLASDLRLAGDLERPVLWLMWPQQRVHAALLRRPRLVYDCVDHASLDPLHGPAMEADRAALAREAELVLATAPRLADGLRPLRDGVLLVPNAVAPEDFAAAPGAPVPADLAAVLAGGRPVVGYMGAFAPWVDWALLNAVTAGAPDLSFVLLGADYGGALARLAPRPNVHVLGEKPHGALAGYACRLDAAMIPFVLDEVTRAASPVKLHEYLAAGAPVVSTPIDACLGEPAVAVADGPDAFAAALRAAVGRRDDPAHRALRERAVAANTWAGRAEQILRALGAG